MGSLAIVVTRDIVAPSVPTGLLATPISSSQINLSWTASTDTGGSGLKGYNVYRDGSLLISQITTNTYQDTGLNSFQTYAYRVSSVDNATNESAQSTQASAQTPDLAAPSVPTGLSATAVSSSQINLSWTGSTDTGGSGLKSYKVYRNGSLISSPAVTSLSDTGLTASTAYTYRVSAIDNSLNESAQSSQAGATTQSGGAVTALQDWTARSTSAGVVQALRFGGAATNVTAYRHADLDGTSVNVVWDNADGIVGDGCLRINVPRTASANSGNWRAPMSAAWTTDGQGFGSTPFYVQFRVKLGASRLTPSVNGGGFKCSIFGQYLISSPSSSGSHSNNEIMPVGNAFWRSSLLAYRSDSGINTTSFETTDGNGDVHFQTAVDHGAGIADKFARYCLYQSGNASSGCWFFNEQEWFTVYARVHIVNYGGNPGTGNEIDIYVARDGETSYTPLYNNRNFDIGSDSNLPLGVNGVWFLPYDTNRTSASYDTWQKYDELLVSTQPIACPQAHSVVSGGEPAWMSPLASKQWFLAPTNIANVADPLSSGANAATSGLPGMMNYSGMSADRQQAVIKCLADGGHQDYHGNEVYALYLVNGVLTWVREKDATNSSTWSGSGLLYPDGRPLSGHTYCMDSGGNGTHISFGRSAEYTQGGTDGHLIMEFRANNPGVHDNVNNDWVNHSASANVTGTTNTGNQCCTYDPVTNTFIGFVGGTGAVYVLNASTFARISANTGINMIDGSPQICVALDSVNRMLLVHGTDINGNNIYHWISVANLAAGTVTSGTVSGTDVADTCGIDYDPVNRCFLTYSGGNLKFLRPTFNGTTYTSLGAWGNVSGITGVVPPANGAAPGLMGKFKVIWPNAIGNARSVVAYMPGWGTNGNQMHLMPLAAGAIP